MTTYAIPCRISRPTLTHSKSDYETESREVDVIVNSDEIGKCCEECDARIALQAAIDASGYADGTALEIDIDLEEMVRVH